MSRRMMLLVSLLLQPLEGLSAGVIARVAGVLLLAVCIYVGVYKKKKVQDKILLSARSEHQSIQAARASVKGTLFTAIKANPDLVPSLLTLAMNDAMTYDKFYHPKGYELTIGVESSVIFFFEDCFHVNFFPLQTHINVY
ncbi:unnamed protein product [Camellia sinensis]